MVVVLARQKYKYAVESLFKNFFLESGSWEEAGDLSGFFGRPGSFYRVFVGEAETLDRKETQTAALAHPAIAPLRVRTRNDPLQKTGFRVRG